MARTIKDNKNVIQSYILTKAKYDFSVYEKRIMYRLVEYAQGELNGILIRDNMHKIEHSLWNVEITMPVSAILKDEQDKNYSNAKEAFKSLACKGVEYRDDEMWSFTNIISSPKIHFRSGLARFTVDNAVWDCLLNFTKGYRKYELVTAMSFRSVYSMRMYELLSGQSTPLEFSLDELRECFGLLKKDKKGTIVESKYQLTNDFKKRVLDVAKKELDKSSPYSFDYIDVKEGRKVVGFRFFPIFHPERQDKKLLAEEKQAKLSASWQIRPSTYQVLQYTYGFTAKELNRNKDTFIKGIENIPDIDTWLMALKSHAKIADNPKGYVVNAVKAKTRELQEEKMSNMSVADRLLRDIDDIRRKGRQ